MICYNMTSYDMMWDAGRLDLGGPSRRQDRPGLLAPFYIQQELLQFRGVKLLKTRASEGNFLNHPWRAIAISGSLWVYTWNPSSWMRSARKLQQRMQQRRSCDVLVWLLASKSRVSAGSFFVMRCGFNAIMPPFASPRVMPGQWKGKVQILQVASGCS